LEELYSVPQNILLPARKPLPWIWRIQYSKTYPTNNENRCSRPQQLTHMAPQHSLNQGARKAPKSWYWDKAVATGKTSIIKSQTGLTGVSLSQKGKGLWLLNQYMPLGLKWSPTHFKMTRTQFSIQEIQ